MPGMEILRYVFLVFHLFGFAALMGGVFYQLRGKDPVTGGYMVSSAVVQLVTGAGLIWTRISQDLPVDDTKMQVKLALDVLVAVTALVGMRNRRPSTPWGRSLRRRQSWPSRGSSYPVPRTAAFREPNGRGPGASDRLSRRHVSSPLSFQRLEGPGSRSLSLIHI